MNIAQLLVRTARAHPCRLALARGAAPVATYAQLAAKVARLAGFLRGRLALMPGERVALFMANCTQYVEALFACWHAGLCAVPINAKLHPRELAGILEDCGARALVVRGTSPAAGFAGHVIDVTGARFDARGVEPIEVSECAADEVAWLFYTSGTTGRPKGVMLTHANLMAMTLGYFSDVDAIDPGDSILHAAPMSHGSGLYAVPHVAHAAVQVVPESGAFEASEVLELVARHRGATMFAAPTMVRRLVESRSDADTANLKTIVYGGGPMYAADCRRAMQRFGYKLAQIYGQGESPMTITALSKAMHADTGHPRYEERLASVGIAQAGMEVRIADASGAVLPEGSAGEVLVRGAAVMRGYWNNRRATEETLAGGWLHTGDVGWLDAEGFLTLRDRSKDVIISGGSNIYPREIEEVLLRHPLVAEASVVGRPDPEWGESAVAFIVPRGPGRPARHELEALCLDHIARFKRPKEYRYLDALPKNEAGKVLKTELRKLL